MQLLEDKGQMPRAELIDERFLLDHCVQTLASAKFSTKPDHVVFDLRLPPYPLSRFISRNYRALNKSHTVYRLVILSGVTDARPCFNSRVT